MIMSISTMSDHQFDYCVHYSEGPGEQPGKTITFESIRQYLNIVRRVSNTAIMRVRASSPAGQHLTKSLRTILLRHHLSGSSII